jgi:hypothetical protein
LTGAFALRAKARAWAVLLAVTLGRLEELLELAEAPRVNWGAARVQTRRLAHTEREREREKGNMG